MGLRRHWKTWSFIFIITILSWLITSCKTIHPTHPTPIQSTQAVLQEGIDGNRKLAMGARRPAIPDGINSELLPSLTKYVSNQRPAEMTFDVNANSTPVNDFFTSLVAGTPYNMVINPQVTGTITLKLKNVTLLQTLDAVRDIYGYDYHRTSYGIEILPPQMETRLYHVNYLDVKRTGKSFTQLVSGQVSNKVGTFTSGVPGTSSQAPTSGGNYEQGTGTISSIETKSEMEFWKDIDKALKNMLPDDKAHNVTVNSQAGVIAVHAFPIELRRISHFINSLQSSLNRQVILEAKILEVQLDDSFQSGIDWGVLTNPNANNSSFNAPGTPNITGGMTQTGNQTFPDTDLQTFNGIFALRVNGNFKVLINLLQTQGNVQVLSSPHISTVNNQKAVIKVGDDEFFVTGVSTTNSVIGTTTLPSQDVSLTPFFSGITLDVTPEISKDDTVTLHIHPSVSKVTSQTKTISIGTNVNGTPNNLVLPLAKSTIRESDNIVRAKNGQVIVIGGLMQNDMTETIGGTPGLSKLPFLGSLFRRTTQTSRKIELVILLRPIIADSKNTINKLVKEKEVFQQLRRPFHQGGLPRVFGNEGERGDNE